jgi:hypothetical protein
MPHVRLVVLLVLTALSLTACFGTGSTDPSAGPTAAPDVGACRMLSRGDLGRDSNNTAVVDCARPHDAQTYAVGSLPATYAHAAYDDDGLAAYAYRLCARKFSTYTGADESLAMRTILSWASFRPSTSAWRAGARWYRCDVVGGGDQTVRLLDLPPSAKGLLLGRPPDAWMVCARGATVAQSDKVPCTDDHNWRAVTTIVLGEEHDPYPGDQAVEAKTRDFCSKSVGAWLDYPVNYDFGYSWFHQAEWNAGNRRSVCWARTDQ